jgi:hypothetical protein
MSLEAISNEPAMKLMRSACQQRLAKYREQFQHITVQFNKYTPSSNESTQNLFDMRAKQAGQ